MLRLDSPSPALADTEFDFRKNRWLIAPLNSPGAGEGDNHGTHWSILVYEVVHRPASKDHSPVVGACHFDSSVGQINKARSEAVHQDLERFVAKGSLPDVVLQPGVTQKFCPKQRDGDSCGCFSALITYAVTTGMSECMASIKFSPEMARFWLQEIVLRLYRVATFLV